MSSKWSLFFFFFLNMCSMFVIAFLPRSKHPLYSWLQSLSTVILETKKIKSVTVSIISPSVCHEVMGLDAMVSFWMLTFESALYLFSFTLFKRLSSSSSLSTIRVVLSAYWDTQVELVVNSPPANAEDIRDMGLIRGSPKERHSNPSQYSCLEKPMDRGDWWAIVYGVPKSQTQLKWLSNIHLYICSCLYFS